MDREMILEFIQTIGFPTALSVYLLYSNNKHMEKYEMLIEKITGELNYLNENIKSITKTK